MKYVDEFRDPVKAQALLGEIRRLAEAIGRTRTRPLQIMEVCGGHTHTIFRYGIQQMLPETIEFVHGPGCPVCVLPMGRVDDCVALAERPEVIFTTFGDAMRVPGSRKSLLKAKADGADVRMVYSPLDALAIAEKHPQREVIFFGLGFETTMPSTAMTVIEAHRRSVANFSLFCNHITIIPTIKAILDSPDLHLDGFLGPGHVSMVIGTGIYEFIARHYAKPITIAGFEPLDVLQSLWMVLAQIAEGRCEVENQYGRVVPREGNARALAAIGEVFELREFFEWRGLGSIDQSGVRLRERYAAYDAEKKFGVPNISIADPKACQCGEVLKGVIKPRQCKVFGTACTPESPLGSLMVSSEGACAAYYQVRPNGRGGGEGRRMNVATPTRPRRVGKLNDARINLSHGSGGRAMRALIEDVFVAAFDNPLLGALEDQAVLPLAGLATLGDRLAFTTDTYVVDPLFFPGGDIGTLAVAGTVNDLAMSGARPLFLSCGMVLEEGLDVAVLRRVVASMKRIADQAGVAIVTGDTKVVERGATDKLFINTAGIGVVPHGVAISAAQARPGDVVIVNGMLGDHGTAILIARNQLALQADVESDCQPLDGLVAAMLAACPAIHCLRDATRGGVATVLNEFAQHSNVGIRIRERALPLREEVKGACEILGLDPLYLANEGKLVAIVAAADAGRVLAAMRAHPAGADAVAIGEVTDQPAGMVVLHTGFGGERIVDMLVGEQLPRIC